LIKLPYWLGIAADALWAAALLFPQVFGLLVGNPVFNPDLQTRLIMGIGGTMMTGWIVLLFWGIRKPIERRIVAFITAVPIILGLFILALIAYLTGMTSSIWLIVKTVILFIFFITSYILAGKMDETEN
ncbi:hypothetical protein ACFL7D_11855, partial [candidate division KSB1 bacterium]